ncbi:ABC transporter permease [candidate division MSBL1 archaeon SCGC-AAA259J03]|uniref:ABC transporter permease n=1 Tax=candidate division MSBL1 archaeon SCGC-AAA259J03 TaxID=1698269 RepID=A0A656YZY8_9EURY|nr:ABC transporter permease [candidate division MSBL1 archaeon SCGC-AAA259J03]
MGIGCPLMDREEMKLTLSLMVPGLTIFIIFAVFPILHSSIGSFFNWERWEMAEFAGLDLWIETLTDNSVINPSGVLNFEFPMGVLPHNLLWMVVHVPISVFLGLGLALLLTDVKGGNVFRTIIFTTFTITPMVIGMVLRFSLHQEAGFFNAILRVIGLGQFTQNWLLNSQQAIFFVIGAGVWVQAGFSMVVYHSGLAGLDETLVEAAEVDGATAFERFKDIIWPRLKPVTAVVVVMSLVWVLRVFAIVYAAGGPTGGPRGAFNVLGVEIFQSAFRRPIEYGRAIILAVIEIIVAIPLAIYSAKLRRF